jgi:Na+-transporting NADH:ubiquinone oxidoreductase subunit A
MAVHTNKKGLDLPITGGPKQTIEDGARVTKVASVAADYVFMKPRMAVKVGDEVKRGQLLFGDRKQEGVRHTAPGAGRVVAVNRGRFRALQSVVIELNEREQEGKPTADDFMEFESFAAVAGKKASSLERKAVVDLLVESGLWTAIRQRPFGRIPSPADEAPAALVVSAHDSNPGTADPAVVLEGKDKDFERGLAVLSSLSDKTFLARKVGSRIGAGDSGAAVEEFKGPHPSGTAGFQIHKIMPATRERIIWYVGYQQVVSIGRLFDNGRLDVEQVVALSGPTVVEPRLLKTRVGACIDELVAGGLKEVENRVISGSVLSGRTAMGELHGYLGRYDNQVSALEEDRERVLMGWLLPGFDQFSTSGIYASQFDKKKKFDFTTTTNGSHRAMVPIGMYERIFAFDDILPTFLLRALISRDLGRAEELGAMELDAEDLALCTFVSPGKEDYGKALRDNLEQIWKEG